MSTSPNSHLFIKTVFLGGLLAALVYLFHPGVGQFTLLINGQPVAEPLFRLAAIPASLIVMAFIVVLAILATLGVGIMLFMGTLGFGLLAVLLIAPYFWPVLMIFCLIILIMSSGEKS